MVPCVIESPKNTKVLVSVGIGADPGWKEIMRVKIKNKIIRWLFPILNMFFTDSINFFKIFNCERIHFLQMGRGSSLYLLAKKISFFR